MDIGNFQIDNLINEEMPVLLGSKNYYDKKIFVHGEDFGSKFNLAYAFKLFEKQDLKESEVDKHGN